MPLPLYVHLLAVAGFVMVFVLGYAVYAMEKGLAPHHREGYVPEAPTESAPAAAVEPASVREPARNDNGRKLVKAA